MVCENLLGQALDRQLSRLFASPCLTSDAGGLSAAKTICSVGLQKLLHCGQGQCALFRLWRSMGCSMLLRCAQALAEAAWQRRLDSPCLVQFKCEQLSDIYFDEHGLELGCF